MAEPDEIYRTIDKLTPAQERALGLIAIGLDGCLHPKPVAALLARGLVEKYTQSLPGLRFSTTINRYRVPLHVHVVWCQWCSDHVTAEDLAAIERGDDWQ